MMASARTPVRERESLDWLLLLSVAALAFNTHGETIPLLIYLGIAAIGYLRPAVLRAWPLWIAIALTQGTLQLLWWEGIDDHVIVGTYWALAIGLGLAVGDPTRVMRTSGRWMIGLIFLFAAGWKIATADFRSGDFFSLYLLADPRFSLIADVVGGVDPEVFQLNRELIATLYSPTMDVSQVTLELGGRVRGLALVMTYWGIFIEAALAITWLAPLRGRARAARHVALLLFCVTTYGLVAITGFAGILLAMAASVAEPESVWRRAHVAAFALIALWTPIWRWLFL